MENFVEEKCWVLGFDKSRFCSVKIWTYEVNLKEASEGLTNVSLSSHTLSLYC